MKKKDRGQKRRNTTFLFGRTERSLQKTAESEDQTTTRS